MPLTFEALKSQRYRWCFGGIQILRMHLRSMLPGRRTAHNRLDAAQRCAYLAGGLQWYGDLLGLAFYLFLLAGAINLATGGGQLFRRLTLFLVATVPVLVALGLMRAVALLRRGTGATWRDALGALLVWQSTSIAVARASTLGLFARKAAFLRTPKTNESTPWWQSFRANWLETLLAVLGVLGIAAGLTRLDTYAGPLLAALLVFPTLGMAAAPFNSLAARRAALPGYLRERRRTEWVRERGLLIGGAAVGGTTFVLAGIATVLLLLLTPTTRLIPPPHLHNPNPHSVVPNTTPTPSAPPSAPASGGPASNGPTPAGSGSGSSTTGGPPTGSAPAPSAPGSTSPPATGQPGP